MNGQARRQPPRTRKRLGLPLTNITALETVDPTTIRATGAMLAVHADALERRVHPMDKRSRSIIRQMRRVESFYKQVMEER